VFLPLTLHFATRLAWRFARSASLLLSSTHGCWFRAIGEVVALVALLSGIALSPELLSRYGRLSKNRELVSVLRVRTSWSSAHLPSPASHALDPLAPYCCTQLGPYCPLLLPPPRVSASSGIPSGSDALSPVTRDHVRDAVISSGRPLAYPLWLASPLLSGSPRRVTPLVLLPLPRFTLRSHPVVVNVFHCIVLPPWMFLKSAASPITGDSPSPTRSPL